MKLEIYFYSFTGVSKEIAKSLGALLGVEPKEIEGPSWGYPLWLFLSFIPHLRVKIRFERPKGNYGILVFPKWTFNCPPVTAFLKEVFFERLFLVISYGGWREKPFGEYYVRLARERAKEVAVDYIKRAHWLENKEREIQRLWLSLENFFGPEAL